MTDPVLHEVRLLGLPVELHRRSDEHAQGLQREFDLIRRREPDPDEVPSRMLTLIDQLNADFGGLNLDADASLHAAMERQDEAIDLTYQVPLEATDACLQLGALLDEADEYCRRGGGLLTLATPPEALAYRRWFLGEFVRQLSGEEPTAWPGFSLDTDDGEDEDLQTVAGAPATLAGPSALGSWAVEGPERAPELVVAGELDVATSRRLREALLELQAGGAETLTVDLTAVPFVDSVAVSVLVTAHLRLADTGAQLVVEVGPAVHRVLEVAGLTGVLAVRLVDAG